MRSLALTLFAGALLAVPVMATDHYVGAPSGGDDWPRIKNKFNLVQSGDRVIFQTGAQYKLYPPATPPFSLTVQGTPTAYKSNVEIVGNQATLVLEGFQINAETPYIGAGGLFVFQYVNDLSIHDLIIDMSRAPYSCGEVKWISGDGKKVRVGFYSEFLDVTPSIDIDAFMNFYPSVGGATPLPDGEGCDYFDDCATVSAVIGQPTWLEFDFSGQPSGFQVPNVQIDDPVTITHNKYVYNGLHILDCSAVDVTNMTIKRITGMALMAAGCDGIISVNNFQVPEDLNPHHLMAVTADGLHFLACKGLVRITGGSLARLGDDGVNVGNNYLKYTEVNPAGSTRIKVNEVLTGALPGGVWYTKFEPGDVIEFYINQDPAIASNLLPVAMAKVVAYEPGPSLPGIGVTEHFLTLDAVPGGLAPGMLLSNVTRLPAVEIDGLTVKANRARGVLLASRDVQVEGCTFKDCTGPGVLIWCDKNNFFEGPGSHDVAIRNCLLQSVNNGAVYDRAALAVLADVPKFPTPHPIPLAGVHRSVWIEGNDIQTTERSAVYVGSTERALLLKNTATAVSLSATPGSSEEYAIYFENVDSPVVAGGQLFPPLAYALGYVGVTPTGVPYVCSCP